MAGTFSVVGLIVLALVIALATNCIRRKRARAFDRELAEATREAASAPHPMFLDDEDDWNKGAESGYGGTAGRAGYGAGPGMGPGYGGGVGSGADMTRSLSTSGGQFSDVSSHGTYAQPAMSIGSHGESYGMREFGNSGAGVGEIYDPYAAAAGGAAGAAGIGVARARSMRSDGHVSPGAGLNEGGAPYAAFAAPANAPPMPSMPVGVAMGDPFNNGVGMAMGDPYAAGVAAAGVGAGGLARNQSLYNSQYSYGAGQQQNLHQRSPSQTSPNRSPSDGHGGYERGHAPYPPGVPNSAATGSTQYFSPGVESYASHYAAGGAASAAAIGAAAQRHSIIDDDEDAYGGYEHTPSPAAAGAAQRQSTLANPFDAGPGSSSHGHGHVTGGASGRESRSSEYSQDDEPRRVLKVRSSLDSLMECVLILPFFPLYRLQMQIKLASPTSSNANTNANANIKC